MIDPNRCIDEDHALRAADRLQSGLQCRRTRQPFQALTFDQAFNAARTRAVLSVGQAGIGSAFASKSSSRARVVRIGHLSHLHRIKYGSNDDYFNAYRWRKSAIHRRTTVGSTVASADFAPDVARTRRKLGGWVGDWCGAAEPLSDLLAPVEGNPNGGTNGAMKTVKRLLSSRKILLSGMSQSAMAPAIHLAQRAASSDCHRSGLVSAVILVP